MKRRVFISYKRVDQGIVFDIQKNIENAIREKCWIDQEGIPSDSRWDDEIKSAIDDCEVFVFVCSKTHSAIESLEEDWTYRELSYASEQSKHIEILKIDREPLPDWVSRCVPSASVIDIDDLERVQTIYADLFKLLGGADERKRNSMPDGIFKVGNLHYCAMDDRLTVEVVNPCKGVKDSTNPNDSLAINIPDSIIYAGYEYEVVKIGENAFKDCSNLKRVIIPDGVRSIGSSAFDGCKSMFYIDVPDSVADIGDFAFSHCSSLKSIRIPKDIVRIECCVFESCHSLTSIEIPYGVESIGCSAFAYCSALRSIHVPDSVNFIDRGAFTGCSSMTFIKLPDELTVLEERILCDCSSLVSCVIPSNVKKIYSDAFDGCTSLASIVIPTSVEYIMDNAFPGCAALQSIVVERGNKFYDSRNDCNAIIETQTNTLITGCSETVIPLSVTAIGNCAFYGTNILSVTLHEGVISIGYLAFSSCENLMVLSFPSSLEKVGFDPCSGCKSLCVVKIPQGSKEKFMNMDNVKSLNAKFVEI